MLIMITVAQTRNMAIRNTIMIILIMMMEKTDKTDGKTYEVLETS